MAANNPFSKANYMRSGSGGDSGEVVAALEREVVVLTQQLTAKDAISAELKAASTAQLSGKDARIAELEARGR